VDPGLLGWQLAGFLVLNGLHCNLYPVRPSKLTAISIPSPIPVGEASRTGNEGTEFKLRLEPGWVPENAIYGFLDLHYYSVLREFVTKSVGPGRCLDTMVAQYLDAGAQIFKTARPRLFDAVKSIQDRAPKFQEVTLYKCDISEVKLLSSDLLQRVPSQDNDSKLRWGLEGVRAGVTDVILQPIKENFPLRAFIDPCEGPLQYPPTANQRYGAEWYPVINSCTKLETVGGAARLEVAETYIFSYQDEGPLNPKTYNPPLSVEAPFDFSYSAYGATSSVNIRQVSGAKWQITQKSTGAPSSDPKITTTWNRIDLNLIHRPGPRKIRVKVNSNVVGTCQGLDVTVGTITQRKDGNNGCAVDWTFETFSPTGPTASTLLQIRFVVLGGRGPGFGSGSGTVTTEVEYLSESPF
jgi:hypothetical protein